MFKATLILSENSNVDELLSDFLRKCRHGLPEPTAQLVFNETKELVVPLVERGRQLVSIGSQMRVTRELSGETYSIKLIYEGGKQRGLFRRILKTLRG